MGAPQTHHVFVELRETNRAKSPQVENLRTFAFADSRETSRAQSPQVGVFGIALRVLRVSRVFLIAFNRTRLPKLLDRVTLRSDYFVKPAEHSLHRWEVFSVAFAV